MPPTAELDDALVLRLQPVRDTDLIVTLLDPRRGRVDAFARAARKSSRRFGGRLELFIRGRATLKTGRGDLPQLTGFDRAPAPVAEPMDWPRLCLLSTVAELAAVASQPEHADPALHRWACKSLAASAGLQPARLRLASLAMDLGFLQAVGCLPSVDHCAVCGEPMDAGGSWPLAGEGWACATCEPSGRPTDAATLHAIRALVADPIAAHTVFLSQRVGRILRKHADTLLAGVLPRPLRSREPLREALADVAASRPDRTVHATKEVL